MASTNKKPQSIYTHEGAKGKRLTPELELRRSVLSCLLWEREHYEDGEAIADRIRHLVHKAHPNFVADLAIGARNDMKLRHVPLWVARNMVRHDTHKHLVGEVLNTIIQRPDELSEFMAMYWKEGKVPLAAQVKKGLAEAFTKFDAYQLAKYNRKRDINLKDVLFLSHAKPKDSAQAELWKQLINDTLPVPDTWEVALSVPGADKKAEWTRLLKERKLGALALLRNLRNMTQAGVDEGLIREALRNVNVSRVLPFRFIAAANAAPHLEDALEELMLKCLTTQEKLPGKTGFLVDVSGSMDWALSQKSDLNRMDAACGLAMLLREVCEDVAIFSFSADFKRIPPRRGFALRDAIIKSQPHSSTYLGAAVRAVYGSGRDRFKGSYRGHVTFEGQNLKLDRLVVLTDEQSHDPVPDPIGKGYMINVASAKTGVGYGPWTHCDGWSEAIIDWIREMEKCGY